MEKWKVDEIRRSKAIQEAVDAADRIILDASDGSTEETNYLTAVVAEKLLWKALLPLRSAMTKKDQTDRFAEYREENLGEIKVAEMDEATLRSTHSGNMARPNESLWDVRQRKG